MNELIEKLLTGIEKQEQEDLEILHLTSYDNCLSKRARKLLSSELSQRYQLGTLKSREKTDPVAMGEFLLKGLLHVDQFEYEAHRAATKMFSAHQCDFRPLSGMHAMITSLITFTKHNDTVYSIDCGYGGHFATHHVLKCLGRSSALIPIDDKNFTVNLNALSDAVKKNPPKAVYLDVGCALFPLPLQEIRSIVGPDVLIIYDASHTFGLIAGELFQSPLQEGADILQGNTHKTFPGPQKGMFCFKDPSIAEYGMDLLSTGLISSSHTHHCLALYLTLLEIEQFGKEYAKQMVRNGQRLAKALTEVGIEVLAPDLGFTKSNTLLVKGDSVGGHTEACRKFYESSIATNSRHGFGQEVIRIGVQEVTRRGMKEAEMEEIALLMKKALKTNVQKEVLHLTKNFQTVHYSFDP
ncbi:MAG: Fluorothreonine transaldolase [Chlamydiales bacterium]|nr:Fluorothreonine transaldolase [Chlamydiales bacterium]MCH9620007.1 Fluorothreonine transaldolase [Chlamydiales bacterium]MCH9622889.1 Fluorothreonine transaldolase [Chlamydiales bacterium]